MRPRALALAITLLAGCTAPRQEERLDAASIDGAIVISDAFTLHDARSPSHPRTRAPKERPGAPVELAAPPWIAHSAMQRDHWVPRSHAWRTRARDRPWRAQGAPGLERRPRRRGARGGQRGPAGAWRGRAIRRWTRDPGVQRVCVRDHAYAMTKHSRPRRAGPRIPSNMTYAYGGSPPAPDATKRPRRDVRDLGGRNPYMGVVRTGAARNRGNPEWGHAPQGAITSARKRETLQFPRPLPSGQQRSQIPDAQSCPSRPPLRGKERRRGC